MKNTYIAKTDDGRLHAFYHTHEDGIVRRTYENGRWKNPSAIALDARENFSVCISADGRAYVFFTGRDGRLKLCAEQRDGGFAAGTVLDEGGNGRWEGGFHGLVSGKGTFMVYQTRGEGEEEDGVVLSRLSGRGLGTPQKIDVLAGFSEKTFQMQVVKDDHALLLYQVQSRAPSQANGLGFVKKPEIMLGYREITSEKMGGFNAVHISNAPVFDCSWLTTPDSVHFLYIIRNSLGCRLLYRRRHTEGMSAAVTVAEAPRLEKCLMFIVGGKIYACFIINGVPYTCVSAGAGAGFSKPERYRSKICENPEKAVFLFQNPPAPEEFCASEVFVDGNNPWDVQMLPDIYEDFYPLPVHVLQKEDTTKEAPESKPLIKPQAVKKPEPTEAELYYGADGDEAEKLRNRLEELEKRLAEKDKRLLSYAAGMRDASEEYGAANIEWKTKHDRLSMENTALSREIQNQKNVIEMLYREKEERERSLRKEEDVSTGE